VGDRLKGKVALVVGAGSIGPGWGNGKATAVAFAREGARVFCADINRAAAEETARLIKDDGGDAAAHRADVSKAADVAAMVEACVEAYGRVDVLDNNVGIAEIGGVVEVAEAEWDRVFAVNLKSAFLTMKYVIPLMERQGGGSIINISSIASIRYTGVPYATYYASKAALNQLTKTTAPVSPKAMPAATSRTCGAPATVRYRWAMAATLGTSPGPRSISPATRAATSPASSSWSTAASRSNTSEPRPCRFSKSATRRHATPCRRPDKRPAGDCSSGARRRRSTSCTATDCHRDRCR
jgi:NAD(P)-dependent dehydrogenase (short-subunit alcohol dehydrogenase family)